MRGARWLIDSLRDKLPFDKSLGQHFLVNDELLSRAIELGEVSADDHVLEIGPGPGVLTEALLATGCQVTAIEIDSVAVTHLKEAFGPEIESGNFTVLKGDALKEKWPDSLTKVIANIPYQISSPLVEELTRYLRNPRTQELQKVVLLVQEEFAERLVMEYESDVGSLGMTVALDWDSEIEEKIPPHNFSPMPKVNSCYISMEPHGEEWPCDPRLVRQMIHLAFDQRRKKLRSTLKNVPRRLGRVKGWHAGRWKQAFAGHLEDERMERRPDELELDDWVDLCCSFTDFVVES